MSTIGLLIRLIILTIALVWLANTPGTAQIVWHDYVIETSAAFIVIALALILYLFTILYKLWRGLFDGPRAWRLNKKIDHLKNGEMQVAQGLTAIAAGQANQAAKHAKRAYKILGTTPSTQLLLAQSAQLAGDNNKAKTIFEEMTAHPDSMILGYRGLIMQSLREGRTDEANKYVHLLESEHPDLPWLNLVRYDLAISQQQWPQAIQALGKAKKAKAVPPNLTIRQEATLLLAQAKAALKASAPKVAIGHYEKARKLEPEWIPCLLVGAEAYIVAGKERAAIKLIEKAWKNQPHAQLVPLYRWAYHKETAINFYKKLQRLTRSNKDHKVSLTALAEGALKADLWGEARRFLMALVHNNMATQYTYKLLIKLEQRETHNEKAQADWQEKAIRAPADAAWYCSNCSKIHDYWEANCTECHAFNSLDWHQPGESHTINTKQNLLTDYLS